MHSTEINKEFSDLFQQVKRKQVDEYIIYFIEKELKNPGSFLIWFQSSLIEYSQESHLLFKYIYLFNALIPKHIDPNINLLLDISALLMDMARNNLLASEAHSALVAYCRLSSENLKSVLNTITLNIDRWESCASVIIQTCYTNNCESIPLFLLDTLRFETDSIRYVIPMSCNHLELSKSSDVNKAHFLTILQKYNERFPLLPLNREKAALFCAIMHFSSQLNVSSSKKLLLSFIDLLLHTTDVPLEFSFPVFQYFFNKHRSKKALSQQSWEIISHLLHVTKIDTKKSCWPISYLMEQLYVYSHDQGQDILFAFLKNNPDTDIEEFDSVIKLMKTDNKLLKFVMLMLMDGGKTLITRDKNMISQTLHVPIKDLADVMIDFNDSDLIFLAKKGIYTLWITPKLLCPFLLAILDKISSIQLKAIIIKYLIHWVVIPYPKAFRESKKEILADPSSTETQRENIEELYEYAKIFESNLKEIPRLKEIQPSLQQQYHLNIYDAEKQDAIFKQSKEKSVIRQLATEIPILFTYSTLDIHEGSPNKDESFGVNEMKIQSFSIELHRRMLWEYPSVEMELAIFSLEEHN